MGCRPPASFVTADDDLTLRGTQRRWRPTEARLQLLAELIVLIGDAPPYDTLLERSASLIASRAGGGCVIALLTPDGEQLHPLGLDHPDTSARAALERLLGGKFTPIPSLEQDVLRSARGRRLEIGPDLSIDRPGLDAYLELTGRGHSALVPLRAGDRSIGLLYAPSHDEHGDEDDGVSFFELIATLLGLSVEHARLGEAPKPSPPQSTVARVEALTKREREVMSGVAAGLTSRELGERLFLSQRTVEWHRSRLMAKLGVNSRAELTRIARDVGLLDDPPGPDVV